VRSRNLQDAGIILDLAISCAGEEMDVDPIKDQQNDESDTAAFFTAPTRFWRMKARTKTSEAFCIFSEASYILELLLLLLQRSALGRLN
jgi:hypothetical protein